MVKGENAFYLHFSPFPQRFQLCETQILIFIQYLLSSLPQCFRMGWTGQKCSRFEIIVNIKIDYKYTIL